MSDAREWGEKEEEWRCGACGGQDADCQVAIVIRRDSRWNLRLRHTHTCGTVGLTSLQVDNAQSLKIQGLVLVNNLDNIRLFLSGFWRQNWCLVPGDPGLYCKMTFNILLLLIDFLKIIYVFSVFVLCKVDLGPICMRFKRSDILASGSHFPLVSKGLRTSSLHPIVRGFIDKKASLDAQYGNPLGWRRSRSTLLCKSFNLSLYNASEAIRGSPGISGVRITLLQLYILTTSKAL